MNSYSLLAALQRFLDQRGISVDGLTADQMVRAMIDWFRFVPVDQLERGASADALVYRYGGWSEGCATAFKLSVLRRVTERNANGDKTEWFAGITLLFEPSQQAELAPFSTVSSDWKSIEAFLEAIESSPAFKALAAARPMATMTESGGVR